ncbi:MAG: DUF3052 family protein [Deltaproteobacteria bacterium]|nr:DUF3052 family protein [Deltaproteobacteria bacterium]MCW5805060.1 DUF3052 family protein [Deltaproteobacteria bacterium]
MARASAPAGYSGTPLPQKLGIQAGFHVAILDGPTGFGLGTTPSGAVVHTSLPPVAKGKTPQLVDVIIAFVRQRADLVERIATCRPRMTQAGGLWIAWPKKASKVPTDITEDTVREVALPTGLVDNKVCAIDATWSGLRLVIRKELRTTPTAKPR